MRRSVAVMVTVAVLQVVPAVRADDWGDGGAIRFAQAEAEDPWDDTIETDRPDFTEASSTVPRGRLQLEGGYTYGRDEEDGVAVDSHLAPELLLRYGLNDWFELRFDWAGWGQVRVEDQATGRVDRFSGITDLGVGCKVQLIGQQEKLLPQAALIASLSAPTGDEGLTSDQVDTVLNLCYSWDLTDRLGLAASTGNTWTALEEDQFQVFHQSAALGYDLTGRLGVYGEWFVLMPRGAEFDEDEHYLDGGLTFLITPDFQLDWRAGLGLNEAAEDFFTGAGFAVRF